MSVEILGMTRDEFDREIDGGRYRAEKELIETRRLRLARDARFGTAEQETNNAENG